MTEPDPWVEQPWSKQGQGHNPIIKATVQMSGFVVVAYGSKGFRNWWWEIFHEQQKMRSLRKAGGGGDMTEEGAKNVALGVLSVAIYADGEK